MDKNQTIGFLVVALVLAVGIIWLQRTLYAAAREINKSIQDIPEGFLRMISR